eukprot:CAMPEP_0172317676 /NCGR_PEP_ID=MMETSP1058-20130122/32387_1 /TAXON_ID=83371 /ORGANISM="Detonula confervacea, Strain CCMP 353" /LENGTH=717 /DNA_ID=CAMNT_0013032293 /DNA_START=50 /DNA_END=2203 /DNA_ORIENTATION=-
MSDKTSKSAPTSDSSTRPPSAASSASEINGSGAESVAPTTSPETDAIATASGNNIDGMLGGNGTHMMISSQKTEDGSGATVAIASGSVEAASQPAQVIHQQAQPAQVHQQAQPAQAHQQVQPQTQVGGLFGTHQHPQNPQAQASMFHPMFSQYAMLHPQFQLTPQQQQMLMFQQHLMMQQMAQQSIQQQLLQQAQSQSQPANLAQNSYAQQMAQQSIIQQQLLQQTIQQQLLHQSQSAQPIAPIAQQIIGQDPNAPFLQAAPYWNLQNPQGIPAAGIEAIYQADESNYQAHHDSDDEDDDNRSSRTLLRLVEDHHWVAALQRITTHPRETEVVGIQGRTPLHVACDHDAPPPLVQALLSAWPEGAERVGTSHMNPLHITCSSPHASVDVVRVLLAGCRDSLMITGAKDVDGDTPLHAACRCAAPMDVLVTLLQANPITVTWKDYEGLNPFMRLWVRYFVLVGEHIISNIKQPRDLTGDLVEAWQKSLLLLQVMSAMETRGGGYNSDQQQAAPFHTVHAASSVDCPRCVVRIARVLFPQELLRRDGQNRLPIHIAAAAPVYAVHDLRGEGFTIDDAFDDGPPEQRASRPKKNQNKYKEPSVIDILLDGEPSAASERDPHGQLPLHAAIMRGKTLDEGVQALVEAYPDALTTPENETNLYPFMLAASVGRRRGDCATIYALLRAAPELVHMALSGQLQDVKEGEKSELGEKPRAVKTDF